MSGVAVNAYDICWFRGLRRPDGGFGIRLEPLESRWAVFTDDELAIIGLAPFDFSIEAHRIFREGYQAELKRRKA